MGPVIGWNDVLGLLEQINADVYSVVFFFGGGKFV